MWLDHIGIGLMQLQPGDIVRPQRGDISDHSQEILLDGIGIGLPRKDYVQKACADG